MPCALCSECEMPTSAPSSRHSSRAHIIDPSKSFPSSILSATLRLIMPLVIASPIPVAPTPTPSWTQNPHPGRGTSPTLPGGLLLPPVLVAQTISPDLSLATTPMVSVAP